MSQHYYSGYYNYYYSYYYTDQNQNPRLPYDGYECLEYHNKMFCNDGRYVTARLKWFKYP